LGQAQRLSSSCPFFHNSTNQINPKHLFRKVTNVKENLWRKLKWNELNEQLLDSSQSLLWWQLLQHRSDKAALAALHKADREVPVVLVKAVGKADLVDLASSLECHAAHSYCDIQTFRKS
jgi:hypothetical protein